MDQADEEELNKQVMSSNNLSAVGRAFSLHRGAISSPAGPINHSKKISNMSHNSMLSSLNNHQENIYDSKLNEERPLIHKSLGKQQIFSHNGQLVALDLDNLRLSPHLFNDEGQLIDQQHVKNTQHQIISSKPSMRMMRNNLIRNKEMARTNDASGSGNHGTLDHSEMTIGSVSTVFKEF